MSHSHGHTPQSWPVVAALALVLGVYGVALAMHQPQELTARIVADHAQEHHEDAEGPHATVAPPLWMVAPFVLLLGAIAIFPLVPSVEHWWESNLHRFYVAAGLGLVTLGYYYVLHGGPIASHFPVHKVVEPAESGRAALPLAVLGNALVAEYIPFIVLLFSLFTICGGIRIQGDLPAHPLTNTVFLLVGGLLASFVGTTGAAMLLIRPLLETNSERKHVRHTVVFFIFIVCNCGGCLLPIGDPPLFLGYLRGVPFLWTFKLLPQWLVVNGLLLGIYYTWDHFYAYPHEEKRDVVRDETQVRKLRIFGLWPNLPLLLGVVLCVALLDPSKQVPGTDWHPWVFLREVAQLGLVALSLALGGHHVRVANRFSYAPIIEVAALFVGIFITMQPALEILHKEGPRLGIQSPLAFFWLTGGLSSVLDNAPTYVVFFETAKTVSVADTPLVADVPQVLLVAVSLGSVFMGANTYIGNGPNFMVRAIAESSGVRMPSFFGYMKYSLGILVPIFIVLTILSELLHWNWMRLVGL